MWEKVVKLSSQIHHKSKIHVAITHPITALAWQSPTSIHTAWEWECTIPEVSNRPLAMHAGIQDTLVSSIPTCYTCLDITRSHFMMR